MFDMLFFEHCYKVLCIKCLLSFLEILALVELLFIKIVFLGISYMVVNPKRAAALAANDVVRVLNF